MCACMQPEGEGKYIWADESTYEGGWKVNFLVLLHNDTAAALRTCNLTAHAMTML